MKPRYETTFLFIKYNSFLRLLMTSILTSLRTSIELLTIFYLIAFSPWIWWGSHLISKDLPNRRWNRFKSRKISTKICTRAFVRCPLYQWHRWETRSERYEHLWHDYWIIELHSSPIHKLRKEIFCFCMVL